VAVNTKLLGFRQVHSFSEPRENGNFAELAEVPRENDLFLVKAAIQTGVLSLLANVVESRIDRHASRTSHRYLSQGSGIVVIRP
jgi:hypothetical protein